MNSELSADNQLDHENKGIYTRVLRSRRKVKDNEKQSQKNAYKKKIIRYNFTPKFILSVKIDRPFKQNHVLNVLNFLPINENALINPQSEESFISSKFYLKKIKKAVIKNNNLLLTLQNLQQNVEPIYVCQRLKHLGDHICLQLANVLQSIEETLPQIQKTLYHDHQFLENSLQNHLLEMRGKHYFSQYTPELLIISEPFLALLGYDIQEFAVEAIKHQCILYEFFSSRHYARVMYKRLQNIKLIKEHLQGQLQLNECCSLSKMLYTDYLYDRSNHLIKCQLEAGLSKQLTPYISIARHDKTGNRLPKKNVSEEEKIRIQKIQQYKLQVKTKEFEMLKNLVELPKQDDPNFQKLICGYKSIHHQKATVLRVP